jgi:hypothetical protein
MRRFHRPHEQITAVPLHGTGAINIGSSRIAPLKNNRAAAVSLLAISPLVNSHLLGAVEDDRLGEFFAGLE